ncbi:MAG: sulfatase-like hydrolase/transferase, partial [Myxococcales bacterium]|nr:sulfatase-like hydrolase/transferase [Myxococcales bacterium]
REGVVFSRAVATASATLPAHASILTGLYPHGHGARANAVFVADSTRPTLAEILAAHGYDTAAFVSSFALDARFGLDRGFAVYDDEMRRTGASLSFSERRGDETTERAVAWLRSPRARPYFLWVHYYDPHASYDPPEPYASRCANPYDGEIAFMDAQLGRLLDAVDAASRRAPLVVVTADHGEGLGEHGEDSHSYLVQEATIQIPWILRADGVLPRGRRIDGRASQVDLMPTLLSLLGIDAPAGLHGGDWTRALDPNRAVLAETVEGRVNFGWRRLSALYLGDAKLVSGARPALYDLTRDPTESRDVAAENPQAVARLESRLRALRRGEPELLVPTTGARGDDTTQPLAALGYIVTEARSMPASGPGPDPRDLMAAMDRLLLVVDAPANADAIPTWVRLVAWMKGIELPRTDEEAIAVLEAMAERDPDFAPTFYFLALYYNRTNRAEDAARTLERLDAVKRAASGAG